MQRHNHLAATNRKAQLHQCCSGKGENEKLENYVGGEGTRERKELTAAQKWFEEHVKHF
jgi:hypothetical protein